MTPVRNTRRFVATLATAAVAIAMVGQNAASAGDDDVVTSSEVKSALADIPGLMASSDVATTSATADAAVVSTSAESVAVVPKDPQDGISLKADSGPALNLTIPDAATSGDAKVVAPGVVAFPGTDGTATAVQTPENGGVRILRVITDPDASKDQVFPVDLPSGTHLAIQDTGIAVVVDADGNLVFTVDAPWAKDGAGNNVPTTMSVSPDGKSLIQQVVRFTEDPDLRDRMIFLPDYDISMARHIYAGCDVWLNNPVRPLEACGTSGMKSALNGGLNLSILDGWWDEMADGENGWAIGSAEGVTDEHRRDDLEAQALYELLEESVIPLFYGRDEAGIPQRWVEMVRHTLAELGPKVLASRMVRDYTTALYAPAASSFELICADDYAGARDLAGFRGQLNQRWGAVQILGVEDSGSDAATADPESTPGASVTLTAHVELGGLTPERVAVQALVGRVSAEGDILDPTITEMAPTGGPDASGRTLFSAVVSPRHSGRHGYTARVLPKHPNLTDDAELGFVRYPSGTAEDAGPGVVITASGYGATGAAAVTSS